MLTALCSSLQEPHGTTGSTRSLLRRLCCIPTPEHCPDHTTSLLTVDWRCPAPDPLPQRGMEEESFSEETLAKARTAKIFIEHLYHVQGQNVKERRDRCAPTRRVTRRATQQQPHQQQVQVGRPAPPTLHTSTF